MSQNLDTSEISNWRSIITSIVFVITNTIVLFPFDIPVYIPRGLLDATRDTLINARVITQRHGPKDEQDKPPKRFAKFNFQLNFITAPLIADLFLLAIGAIGPREVYEGTIGADNIAPYDVLLVFLCLGYIASSLEDSGLIRWLVFKVIKAGGGFGRRLFCYLYTSFFGLGILIGNDPIMVSFLADMTRISENIVHPRAWIHTQIAVVNIATAILVPSNPTNLVLAGTFNIKFVSWTANLIVPISGTAIILFPFLLYVVFADDSLIPSSIKLPPLLPRTQPEPRVNPNIPDGRGLVTEEGVDEKGRGWSLAVEDILRPLLDIERACLGIFVMTATIVILLVLNAVYLSGGGHPDYWVTLPAAFIMFSKDLLVGWHNRHETRETARLNREKIQRSRDEEARKEEQKKKDASQRQQDQELHQGISSLAKLCVAGAQHQGLNGAGSGNNSNTRRDGEMTFPDGNSASALTVSNPSGRVIAVCMPRQGEPQTLVTNDGLEPSVVRTTQEGCEHQKERTFDEEKDELQQIRAITTFSSSSPDPKNVSDVPEVSEPHSLPNIKSRGENDEKGKKPPQQDLKSLAPPRTLQSLVVDACRWFQETFPAAATALGHLPFVLVPFILSMFVLVQALVSTGWVLIFAHGWSHWVEKTGWVGSMGGMGLISVVLCNFARTNIGASILLSQIILAWQNIQSNNGISDRCFWGTVYSMAIGVNYGAFSMAFSASLAGIIWRDVLSVKGIHVRRLEFIRVNLPIIAIAMAIACGFLIFEVYIFRDDSTYKA
ncbi:hypothetical protein NA56DRAFT_680042 [Hyaloscypha hepaticicola]|uniref:Citrate transporter-like domain-containing protein n=1 Tax=Hyaloscypha hepaticicola TaxID=2082293 RepID=A0A2J6Q107_9HELO|nr:hypothetical protein NA56DRAFT_680042 [Hyaloscypha hepaticicola]